MNNILFTFSSLLEPDNETNIADLSIKVNIPYVLISYFHRMFCRMISYFICSISFLKVRPNCQDADTSNDSSGSVNDLCNSKKKLNFSDNNTMISSPSESSAVFEGSKADHEGVDHSSELFDSTFNKHFGEKASEDILDFLLATPPSRKMIKKSTKKSSKKKVWFDESTLVKSAHSLRTPLRKCQSIRRVKIFDENAVCDDASPISPSETNCETVTKDKTEVEASDSNGKSKHGDDIESCHEQATYGHCQQNNLRKMIYPSANKTRDSLPTMVFNLKESSDGIILENDPSVRNIFKNSNVSSNVLRDSEKCDKKIPISHSFEDSQMFDNTLISQAFEAAESAYACLIADEGESFSQVHPKYFQATVQSPVNESSKSGCVIEKPELPSMSVGMDGLKAVQGEQPAFSSSEKIADFGQGFIDLDFKNATTASQGLEFHGFSTSCGKKIPISDCALKKTELLFSEEHFRHVNDVSANEDKGTFDLDEGVNSDAFFVTGKGKKINVSDNALQKADKLFAGETGGNQPWDFDENSGSLQVKKLHEHSMLGMEKNEIVTPVISTAGSKAVLASDKVLEGANKLNVRAVVRNKEFDLNFVNQSDALAQSNTTDLMCAFSTARGTKLNISVESLKRAMKVFEGVEDQQTEDFTSGNMKQTKLEEVPGLGFFTAGGKEVSTSNDAFIKANRLFDGIDIDDFDSRKSPTSSNQVPQPNIEKLSSLLCTASGKDVSVSEDSLKQTKQLFDAAVDKNIECVAGDRSKQNDSILQSTAGTLRNSLFSTGSREKVAVSDKALEEVSKRFDGIDVEEGKKLNFGTANCTDSIVQGDSTYSRFGVSTASGKKLKVSEEAAKKTKTIFQGIDDQQTDDFTLGGVKENKVDEVPMIGFSTAGGKNVSVSSEAFKETKRLFHGVDVDGVGIFDPVAQGNVQNSRILFSTASGKKVTVSDEALKTTHTLFETMDQAKCKISSGSAKKIPQSKVMKLSSLFSTASGKAVPVSEEALRQSKQLFEATVDESTECATDDWSKQNDLVLPITAACSNSLFSTASGKRVSISEEASTAACKLFDNFSATDSAAKECAEGNNTKHPGSFAEQAMNNLHSIFSTAGGRQISVSDDALKQVRSLFADENQGQLSNDSNDSTIALDNLHLGLADMQVVPAREEANDFKAPAQISSVFSTASGRAVSVSEQTLEKVKSLFNEENCVSSDEINETTNCEEALKKCDDPKLNSSGYSKLLKTSASGDFQSAEMKSKFESDNVELGGLQNISDSGNFNAEGSSYVNAIRSRNLKPVISGPNESLMDRGKQCFSPCLSSPGHKSEYQFLKKKCLRKFESFETLSNKRPLASKDLPPSKKQSSVQFNNSADVCFTTPRNVKYHEARQKQDEAIKAISASDVKPKPGKLMEKYGEKKFKLWDVVDGKAPCGSSLDKVKCIIISLNCFIN